ncbi:MAG: aminotransferase class V-fold PLP-dependent enzyme [Saprospiraceae bacterium]|nr:aminotransferase class V-fold PLP-dependent enzyme [Saprospiraceae bacterium]
MRSRRKFLKSGILASIVPYLGFKSSRHLANKIQQFTSNNTQDLFLLNKDRHFFNTASLGASPHQVVNAYQEWTQKLESISETGHQNVKTCRNATADFLGCLSDEIAITRNTTEGINIVAQGLQLEEGDEIILSTHEHVGGAVPWMNVAKEKNLQLKLVDLDLSGKDNLIVLKNAVSPRTKVISLSHVTCTTGMVLPVKELSSWCRERNIITCIDGAQAIGMIDVNLGDLQPDFYATSGHKWLYGPKGTGFLYINKNSIDMLTPTFAGAYTTDEYNLNELNYSYLKIASREEYGTRNTPIIMSLKSAIDFHTEQGKEIIIEHGFSLARLFKSLLIDIPEVEILSPMDEAFSSAIITFRSPIKGYKEIQQELMKQHKCRVRGIYENELNAIRVSCAYYNTEDQIRYLAAAIKEILS